MESNGTKSEVQDKSSRSGNDTDADDADIRPIYDEEPMSEVQLNAECNIFAIGQQHTEQPKIINEGRVDQYPKKCQVKSHMFDSSPDNQTTVNSKQSLESEDILLKKIVAQFQKDFSKMKAHSQIQEKVFAIAALKNNLRKSKGNSADTKFAKTSVLEKPVLQSLRNQSVVRQSNAFNSEMPQMSKQRFASQVDVNKNLSRPGSLDSCTSKDDSEPTHGSNVDIPIIYESKQTLDLSAGTSINVQKEQSLDFSADMIVMMSMIQLESLFGPLFDEYFTGENLVVSKSFVVTTADASDKRQQQHDSTSSTSNLATSVTANGNFDLLLWHCMIVRSNELDVWKGFEVDCKTVLKSVAQDDRERQIKMIQVKEMMQDKDLKNSNSKDKGSRSRSRGMNEQSHYKQDKTKGMRSSNVKSSMLGRSKRTLTLGEIVSLNFIKSNENVIGLIKSN
ncbi:hypothetical protein Tco_0773049 [Tanacetum coccineum]|uniref:Uncharacterized protein n=1 Tax=Tanacetum coccineum TaxID=301880 RepID=A0ABQ4ZNP3_9ASTR